MGGICFAENISKEIEYFDYYLKIDHDYFPYGNKDLELLKKRLIYLVDNSKSPIIVIACNTLSSLIFHYNLKFKKTVVDVITPTIYFLRKKNYQNITILATKNTINMDIYSMLLGSKIKYINATKLINEIENDIINKETIKEILKEVPKNSDAILLGCTHLIKVKDIFRRMTCTDILSQDEIFVMFLNERL
jgi:glutamate racemase